MIDVNTIIGEPIKALDNTVIIPISKVGFGFAAGGSEFNDETVNLYNKKQKEENIKYRLPFGGGSGAGVNITPVAFLIVQNDTVKLLEASHVSILDKLAEYVPDVIEKINQLVKRKIDKKETYYDYEDDYEDDDDDWYDEEKDLFEEDDEFLDENDELEDFINESEKDDDIKQNKKNKKEENKQELNKIVGKTNKNKAKKMEEKIKEIKIVEEDDDE